MAAIKAYLDEDVHPFIAHALRLRGWEALTTIEAGRRTTTDAEQIDFATRGGFVLLTYNAHDFPRIHTEMMGAGQDHAGIIVATQDDPRRNIRALLKILSERSAEEMQNELVYLSSWT